MNKPYIIVMLQSLVPKLTEILDRELDDFWPANPEYARFDAELSTEELTIIMLALPADLKDGILRIPRRVFRE